ncbi:hypothetical protein [Hyphomonas pacifica]|uniref:Uncharacterized protein n=1 Tax=Hyphomonas pacifica TaxID=1280941 RepID=A0A062U6E4_9PROT|nr:hypothetical protein [Hyphomonas pacifica]KCZ52159.1 hypothetical protein HY2_09085 [Hyphomonas pacifica]RAN35013.1 hypothetical protein HY3_09215 [Hyphomonas pacifica]
MNPLNFFKRQKSTPAKRTIFNRGIQFEISEGDATTIRIADVEQSIGGVRQLTQTGVSEMVDRKHDLDYQYALCQRLMAEGDILPFPFERAVILLRKAKRLEDEQAICRYVAEWCRNAEENWDGRSAKHWLSPKLQRIVARLS